MAMFLLLLFADKKLPTDPRKYEPPEFVEAKFKADTPQDILDALQSAHRRRRAEYELSITAVRKAILALGRAKRGAVVRGQRMSTDGKRVIYGTKQQKLEHVRECERKLESAVARTAILAVDFFYVPEFRGGKKGAIGRTDGGVRVIQVIGKGELLVDANLGIAEPEPVWLIGIETEGITDGKAFRLDMPLRITGTKSYRNALGTTRTVFVAEPFHVEKWVELPETKGED